jgi:hypothetical protein
MEEAYNDASMNDSKVESPRLSEQEKLSCAPNKFQCSFCDSKYSHKCSLYHHVKEKHKEEDYNNWKCSIPKGNGKSSIRKVSANSFQCPYCDSNYSQKSNLYHHVKQKHQENYGTWKLTKSKFYVSNYDRNQSLWKILGENQDIPEWSVCLDCVPHKVLKDSDDSMDKHFAENPEHYQINPAWFYLKFNLYVSDIATQQKSKGIIDIKKK